MIRILNENFEIIETITKYTSIEYEKIFTDYGTFTLQIPLVVSPKNINIDKIIQHKNYYGVIRYISQDNGYITLKGYDLKVLLAQRYVKSDKSDVAETVLKNYITEATLGANRKFDKFGIVTSGGRGTSITHIMEKPQMLSDVAKKICAEQNWGYDITVANKNMKFDIVVPKTVNYVFSKRNNNINAYEYIKDGLNEKNYIYNIGETTSSYFNGTEKTGIFRKETFSEETEDIEKRCKSILDENQLVENIEFDTLKSEDYKIKWDLGDTVKLKARVLNEEITMEKQITQVRETFEPNKHTVVPTFGEVKISILRKIIRNGGV